MKIVLEEYQGWLGCSSVEQEGLGSSGPDPILWLNYKIFSNEVKTVAESPLLQKEGERERQHIINPNYNLWLCLGEASLVHGIICLKSRRLE